jgi:ethanolamine ammonia-lyase large subunit
MISKEAFKDLMQEIIEKHLPEDQDVFDLAGERMINDVLNGDVKRKEDSYAQRYYGAGSGLEVVTIITSILTVYKLILEIIKVRKETKEVDTELYREKLEQRLKDNGMEPDKAKGIAVEFIDEIASLSAS